MSLPFPKRTPRTKRGKLLVNILLHKSFEASIKLQSSGVTPDKDLKTMDRLKQRIFNALANEDVKNFSQCSLFAQHLVSFVKHRGKRKHSIVVYASDRKQAIRMIKIKHPKCKIVR